MSPAARNTGSGLAPVAPPTGCWLVRYRDWSGIALFAEEIEALRYAVEHHMDVCEFVAWGEVR